MLVGQPSIERVRRDARVRASAVDGLELVERLALRERSASQQPQQQVRARRVVDPRADVRTARLNGCGEPIGGSVSIGIP